MRRMRLGVLAFSVVAGSAGVSLAATEIQWWHSMGGFLGAKLEEISFNFNTSQSAFRVVPVFKGTYPETMTAAVAAFRAKKPPHIVQVFEVGTATMMAAKGAVYPVHRLMAETGTPFDPQSFIPAVAGYYSDAQGNMLSMPFNSSTPVLYYNKTAFAEAGVSQPPRTWAELEEAAGKVRAVGYGCGFTTGWQSWVQIENLGSLHDVPVGSESNGFGGLKTRLLLDAPLYVRHIDNMRRWSKEKVFQYGGRRSDAAPLFYNRDCVMFMDSSASLAGIKENVKDFEFGVAMLPYYDDVSGAPRNSIIGGASLWVFSGHSPEEYKGVAEFFRFLSSPEVQADWHQSTGYLPITTAAWELSKAQGFYERNPGADTAIKQVNLNAPTENSRGLRFGNFVQIRDLIDSELEAVWGGKKGAKDALSVIVRQGNALLRQFEKTSG